MEETGEIKLIDIENSENVHADFNLAKVNLSEIEEFLEDDDITDINWNGNALWISHLEKGTYLVDKKLSEKFVKDMATRFANISKMHFNKEAPLLEAQTDDLRVSIYHESVLSGKDSFVIRKVPPRCRINREKIIKEDYMPEEILNFLENSIKSHLNIVIGGLPGAGKTEFLKFLTKSIPPNERVVTIEDNFEIHYSKINPEKDCVEIRVGKSLSFENAIKGSLRHNAKWTLLSEARGREVNELVKGICDGCHILTTIHTDDAKSIPDRMAAMAGDLSNDRFINILHNHIDLGLLINSYETKDGIKRRLEQIVIFTREIDKKTGNYINVQRELYNLFDKECIKMNALSGIIGRFRKVGIENPFEKIS